MRNYKLFRNAIIIYFLLFIFIICAVNIDFLKKEILSVPYDVVPATITEVGFLHNRPSSPESTITYVFNGEQKTISTIRQFGDTIGQPVEILISKDGKKVARNCFLFGWQGCELIIVGVAFICLFWRLHDIEHQRAAIRYAKKLYKRQAQKENDEFK